QLASHPYPPPSVSPPTPVWLTVPPTAAGPRFPRARSTSPHAAPPCTFQAFAAGSPETALMFERSMITPPSRELAPPVECRPPATVKSTDLARQKLMTWDMSDEDSTITTTACVLRFWINTAGIMKIYEHVRCRKLTA